MADSVKGVFEEVCPDVVADRHMASQLQRLQLGFVNRDAEHSEFFGGHLTGVNVVRFTESDSLAWFDDILQSSEVALREPLHALKAINPEWHVSSSTMNLSVIWIVHLLQHSGKLNDKQRHEAQVNALLYLQFKFFCSLLYWFFRYRADRETAEATYAELTNKFTLKTQGSWIGVFRRRAEDILAHSSPHYNTYMRMDNDEDIVKMLNDIQGRLRDMLKNIYRIMMKVHNSGSKISSTSAVVEHDGVAILKDQVHGLARYTNYLKSVITDENSFIRDELVEVIGAIVPTASEKLVRKTLQFMSENYLKRGDRKIDTLVDDTMVHAYGYLLEIQSNIKAGIALAPLLERLKGIYTSSRSQDPNLLALREHTEDIVKKAIETKTAAIIASVRTAVLLYIVSRAFTMRHYTSGG